LTPFSYLLSVNQPECRKSGANRFRVRSRCETGPCRPNRSENSSGQRSPYVVIIRSKYSSNPRPERVRQLCSGFYYAPLLPKPLIPWIRQNSPRGNPLVANSRTSRWTSCRVRRRRALTSSGSASSAHFNKFRREMVGGLVRRIPLFNRSNIKQQLKVLKLQHGRAC
jgi:hypothetical protein